MHEPTPELAPTPEASAPTALAADPKELEELDQLRVSGALSDEEDETAKA